MAEYTSHGALLKLTISASLTTIAQLKSIKLGDKKSETIPIRKLDGSTFATNLNTKVVTHDELTYEGYYDITNSTHQFLTTTIDTPANFPVAGSVVFTDAAPKSVTFSAVGLSHGVNISEGDAIMFNGSAVHNGLTYPTS